ncbi:MAG: gamma carbonic anhydrase family protein [Acidobacteriota bacterium]|nr:MAG: gamma carbonic anhydrase family protein [Acidobacteriota bacterium]
MTPSPERAEGGYFATDLDIDPTAFVAPGAVVVGRVRLGARASVWYGSIVRGDIEPISIGPRTNIQDLCVLHVDVGFPTAIGADVSVGHRAIVHGAVLEDGCLIGMGAVLLNGARIGSGAVVAAGAIVREGFHVPARSLVAGVPARIIRQIDQADTERIRAGAELYVRYAEAYAERRLGGGPFGGS